MKNLFQNRIVKDQQPAGKITYNGATYDPYSYITTKGDTVRGYASSNANRGQIYDIKYTTAPGQQRSESKLTTQNETGELKAGKEYRMSRTSDYGKALDGIFFNPAMSQPVTEDYSKLPFYKLWIYKLMGYKDGGSLNYLNYIK